MSIARLRELGSLVRQYGPRNCLFRFQYGLGRRLGLLKRRFPTWRWRDRPIGTWLGRRDLSDDAFAAELPASAGQFFFPWGRTPRVRPDWAADAVEEADAVLRGEFRYFSRHWGELGYPDPDWMLNPFTGQRDSAELHWCDRGDFAASRGDIKWIWEPARFSWVYALVRAFAATGELRYADAYWRLLESWKHANPPQMGPGWQCGQEAAIRLQAVCFGLWAFAGQEATTAERVASAACLVGALAERIYLNIGYARSQRSNHSVTEAAGLLTAGLLFPGMSDARKWVRLGRRVLAHDAAHHIWDDGSYVMHSLNYQRMSLQNFVWCIRLAELNGHPLESGLCERVHRMATFLYQLQDDVTGWAPNYGSNDGALLLPLSSCEYRDYRPALSSAFFTLTGRCPYPEGPWLEEAQWLCGRGFGETSMSGIARESMRFDVGGYYTLRGGESWGLLRCHHYRSRPSQADQLHLDVWWRGQNILRDSGSFQYYDPPRDRGAYFASTMAHNTLVVGGVSQMRKRSRFRWCSLAGGRLVHFGEGRDAGHIEVEHSGYRVSVGAVHRRCVVLLDEDVWLIVDEVSGSVAAGVDALWHLPDVPVSTEGQVAVVHTQAGPFSLRMTSDRSLGMRMERGGEGATMWGWDSEYYGELKPSPVLIGSITGLPTIVGTLVVLGSDESGDIALGGDVVRVVVGRREWLLRRSGRGPGEESPALMGIRN